MSPLHKSLPTCAAGLESAVSAKSTVLSLAKGLRVLEAFTVQDPEQNLSEMAIIAQHLEKVKLASRSLTPCLQTIDL